MKGCLGFPGSCVQEENSSACLGKVTFICKHIWEIKNIYGVTQTLFLITHIGVIIHLMQLQGKWTGLEFRPTIINGANQVQLQQSILHHTRKDDIDTESDMEIISSTLQ